MKANKIMDFFIAIFIVLSNPVYAAHNNFIYSQYVTGLNNFFMSGIYSEEELLKIDEKILMNLCNNHINRSCYLAGKKYSLGTTKNRDFQLAERAFFQGCSLSNSLSCFELAELYSYGIILDKKEKDYLPLYEKACILNDSLSCERLGRKYKNKDKNKSYEFFKKAYDISSEGCKKANGRDCMVKGVLYLVGEYVKESSIFAKTLFEAGCLFNDSWACFRVTEWYLKENDMAKAKSFLEKSCNLKDPNGCSKLASIYQNENKEELAFNYLKKACDYNDYEACSFVGDTYEYSQMVRSLNLSKDYHKKGCDLGYAHSCTKLAILYAGHYYPEFNPDLSYARLYAEKGCKLNNPNACSTAGLVIPEEESEKKLQYYKKGCALKISDSTCGGVGQYYEDKKEYKEAKKYYELGCGINDFGLSCSRLAELYKSSLGVSKNQSKAMSYLNKACQKDSSYCSGKN